MAKQAELNWLKIARQYIGLTENTSKTAHNPTIVNMLKEMGKFNGEAKAWWNDDDTAWCLQGDIEVLTDVGFVKFEDFKHLNIKSVAQVDLETRKVSFTENFGYVEKDYNGEIYDIKTKSLDISCDPNHRFFGAFCGGKRKYALREIGALSSFGVEIPQISSSNSDYDISDESLILLAVFISDGFFKGGKRIGFNFSKQRKKDIIEKYPILKKHTESKIYGVSQSAMTHYELDRKLLYEYAFTDYKKLDWGFISALSSRQCKIFIDAYGNFDGTINENGSFEVFTADKELQECLNYIATMAGYKSTPFSVKQTNPLCKIEYLHHVYISLNKHRCIRNSSIVRKEYEGKLYCLSVPSQIMVIRSRNGTILPIGNCGTFSGYVLGVAGRWVVREWYRAKSWNAPTELTKIEKPAYGCIVTFTRTGGGHVGFVVGKDKKGNIMVLGGNQGNKVSIAAFAPSRVSGYYWPSKVSGNKPALSIPTDVRYDLPILESNGKVSTNES